MKSVPRVLGVALLAIAPAMACSGQITETVNDPDGAGPGGANPANPGGAVANPGGAVPGAGGGTMVPASMPGPAPLRRLTIHEYNNTVRDLLGIDSAPGRDFASDRESGGFATGGPVTTSTDAARLLESAENMASAAAARLDSLLPCPGIGEDAAAQAACARGFIEKFGRRAFRRPLTTDEVADLEKVYTAHRGGEINHPFKEAVRAVLSAMLVAPQFVYRTEGFGSPPIKDGNVIRFGPHEMAARLSYGLWGTMPDDELFAAADANRLSSKAQLNQQTRRMLADPRAREAITDFHAQWLEIERLAQESKDAKFNQFTPELVAAMGAETAAFAGDILLGPRATGSMEQLFTSSETTVTPALAQLYGATGSGAVTLNPAQRAGLFTQASFLAMHAGTAESNPVRRGAVVLKRVLCTEVPPPPNDDVGQPAPPAAGLTTRERFAMHSMNACATCHVQMDPIGFAFENYDAIGAWRTTEQGDPVDAAGTVKLASGELRFKNAVELMGQLARTPEARDCFSTQWLRYFLRRAELPGDQASLRAAQEVWRKSSYDIRELLVALTEMPAFTHRTLSVGETLP
jgi:hypothetical protein